MPDENLGKPITEVQAESSMELEAQIAALQERANAAKVREKAIVAAKGTEFLAALTAASNGVLKTAGFTPMAVLLTPKDGAYVADFYSPPKRAKAAKVEGAKHEAKPNGGKVTLNKVIEHMGGMDYLELVGNAEKFTTARKTCKAIGLKTWEEDKAGDGAGTSIIAYAKDNKGKVVIHFTGGTSMNLEDAADNAKALLKGK